MVTYLAPLPAELERFPIRCGWAEPGPYAACGAPAVIALTTGCPDGANGPSRPGKYEVLTCDRHLAKFEDRAERTGYHFETVCCDGHGRPGDHGRVILARRPLNEGDLP